MRWAVINIHCIDLIMRAIKPVVNHSAFYNMLNPQITWAMLAFHFRPTKPFESICISCALSLSGRKKKRKENDSSEIPWRKISDYNCEIREQSAKLAQHWPCSFWLHNIPQNSQDQFTSIWNSTIYQTNCGLSKAASISHRVIQSACGDLGLITAPADAALAKWRHYFKMSHNHWGQCKRNALVHLTYNNKI